MNQPVITKKALLSILILACCILLISFIMTVIDRRTKVVFCDVGQGNAEYMRLGDTDILVDTGPPNGSVLSCLGSFMPFYDRTIEYLAISHPQADHDGAAVEILKRYTVKNVVVASVFRNNPQIVLMHKTSPATRFTYIAGHFTVPLPRHAVLEFLAASSLKTLPDDNDRSLIVSLHTIDRWYLFTGDISAAILSALTITYNQNNLILLVPHHGSTYGLSDYFLGNTHIALAVVSVGRKNPYGHPAPHTLELLTKHHIPYRRTDREGTVVLAE